MKMNDKKYGKEKRRKLTLLFVCFLSLLCLGETKDTTVYISPEVQPMFKYGDCTNTYKSCEKYFKVNFKLPDILLDNGYMGRLIIEFIIEKNGAITNVKVLRGIDPVLDKTILNFIKKMPRWTPAVFNRKMVRSKFILPVHIDWLYGDT